MADTIDDARVLRSASAAENYFAMSHDNLTDLSCYSLTLVSRAPLTHNLVLTALRHLYRKLPNLRVCLPRDSDGQLWVCRMKEENIILQYEEDSSNYEEIYINETRKQYDATNGPLWRVTVLPSSGVLDKQAAEDGFGHQYYILFGLHHAITDGHSSFRMCGHFLKILNDVSEEIYIDDTIQLAEHVNGLYNKNIMEKTNEHLKSDHELLLRIIKLIESQNENDQLLVKAYPPQAGINPTIMSVRRELKRLQTEQFFAKAKSQNITVHSAFSTILHAVIADMLIENGNSQESLPMLSHHDVNERRYWNMETEDMFGVHVRCHSTLVKVPNNVTRNFWKNAQMFHCQFQTEIMNRQSLFMETVEKQINPIEKTVENFNANNSVTKSYYAISNMGDVTKIFRTSSGAEHSYIRAVNMCRSTAGHTYEGYNCFCIQTLNGKFLCSLDYNTRYISNVTANKLLDRAFDYMIKVSC